MSTPTMTHQTPSPGMIVTFKGYSDDTVEPLFEIGDSLRVERVNEDGGIIVVSVNDPEMGDTVFPEEIDMPVSETPETETPEDEVPETPAQTTKAIKAKAPKATEAKAKAKAKAKTSKAKSVDVPEEDETPEAPVTKTIAEAPVQSAASVESTALTIVSDEESDLRVLDSERVSAILSEQDALDAAKALVTQVEETYFTLGGVLAHIYYEGIFKSVGYTGKRGFAEYVEKELGVQYRKAMYLIDIYVHFRKLGVDERRLTEIGWSKAKELTKYATPENFDELIELAGTKTREELVEHLRETMVDAEGVNPDRVRRLTLKFQLFQDQGETVTRALDEAKQRVGNDSPEQALEYICAEWLQMTDGIEIPLEDAIRQLQVKYGVTVTVDGGSTDTTDDSETTEEAAGTARRGNLRQRG
jgi:hypothetical protein